MLNKNLNIISLSDNFGMQSLQWSLSFPRRQGPPTVGLWSHSLPPVSDAHSPPWHHAQLSVWPTTNTDWRLGSLGVEEKLRSPWTFGETPVPSARSYKQDKLYWGEFSKRETGMELMEVAQCSSSQYQGTKNVVIVKMLNVLKKKLHRATVPPIEKNCIFCTHKHALLHDLELFPYYLFL